jgi:hypothetical protein
VQRMVRQSYCSRTPLHHLAVGINHFNLSFSSDLIFLVLPPVSDTLQHLSAVLNKCSATNLVSKVGVIIDLVMCSDAIAYRELKVTVCYTW